MDTSDPAPLSPALTLRLVLQAVQSAIPVETEFSITPDSGAYAIHYQSTSASNSTAVLASLAPLLSSHASKTSAHQMKAVDGGPEAGAVRIVDVAPFLTLRGAERFYQAELKDDSRKQHPVASVHLRYLAQANSTRDKWMKKTGNMIIARLGDAKYTVNNLFAALDTTTHVTDTAMTLPWSSHDRAAEAASLLKRIHSAWSDTRDHATSIRAEARTTARALQAVRLAALASIGAMRQSSSDLANLCATELEEQGR